jgi:hypothetical protein
VDYFLKACSCPALARYRLEYDISENTLQVDSPPNLLKVAAFDLHLSSLLPQQQQLPQQKALIASIYRERKNKNKTSSAAGVTATKRRKVARNRYLVVYNDMKKLPSGRASARPHISST